MFIFALRYVRFALSWLGPTLPIDDEAGVLGLWEMKHTAEDRTGGVTRPPPNSPTLSSEINNTDTFLDFLSAVEKLNKFGDWASEIKGGAEGDRGVSMVPGYKQRAAARNFLTGTVYLSRHWL